MFSSYRHRYTALTDNVPTKLGEHRLNRLLLMLLGVLAGTACFYLGRISQSYAPASPEPHLRMVDNTFQYERLFGSHPSPESDHAWLHLFPSGAGFFKHPKLATKRSAFSAFHQLHCLDGIRHGYWTLYDAAASGERLNETDMPAMASPPHIRHCIDLLRQALMCRPDLTVEEKDEELGGVSGFGTMHRCYDWGQLVSWTRKWQDWGAEGEQEMGGHGHHHHGER